jgi:glycosyltransferase involved in cell wall biosynthesis
VRVGLDVSLVPGQRVGVGQYAYQLARALGAVDRDTDYRLYPVFYHIVHPQYWHAALPAAPNMRVAFRHLPPTLVLRLWRRPGAERMKERLLGDVDVVHSTTYCAPRFASRRRRLVVTIYDLTVLTHPEFHLPANVAHCLGGTRRAIERAAALIAISEHTRAELVERLGAPKDLVRVVHCAVDPGLRRVTDPARLAAVRRRYALPEHFALFLGALEPRKNVLRLVEAWAALDPAMRRDVRLVLAGAKGWLNDSIHARVAELGVERSVQVIGYVAEADVAALYSLATVFAYPSLAEGFGLPVVEAMACGTPVLTSDASSLPEVAGDAALCVSPTRVDEIAGGLARLLGDTALRRELARRGLERAARYSWERAARETLAVYRAVAG